MKPNSIHFLVCFCLIISNLISLAFVLKLQPKTILVNKPDNESFNLISSNFVSLITQNDGVNIDLNTELRGLDSVKINLSNLLKAEDNKILFFRFSSYDCESCIDTIFNVLKTYVYANDNQKNNIIVISDNDDIRDFIIKYGKNTFPFKIFTINPESLQYSNKTFLGLPIEGKGIPIFFTVNKLAQSDNIFVPNQNQPELTKNYIKTVLSKFQIL